MPADICEWDGMSRTALTPSKPRPGRGKAATLFGEVEPAPSAAEEFPESLEPVKGPFAAVVLEQSIDRSLDYAVPAHLVQSVRVGQRVRVPLGKRNRPVPGYVVALNETTDYPKPHKIKSVVDIEDERVLVPPKLMELCGG